MKGVPQKAKGSRGPPGTALGQSVARWCNLWSFSVTFLDTFWHPWRHPGRSRGVPLGTFCITFVSIFAVSAPGTSLWVARVSSRSSLGGACKTSKYRCFAKVRLWSPRCQKGMPRGAPGRVFSTFWSPFEPPERPFPHPWPLRGRTLRQLWTKVCIYAYLLRFGSRRDPSQPVNPHLPVRPRHRGNLTSFDFIAPRVLRSTSIPLEACFP